MITLINHWDYDHSLPLLLTAMVLLHYFYTNIKALLRSLQMLITQYTDSMPAKIYIIFTPSIHQSASISQVVSTKSFLHTDYQLHSYKLIISRFLQRSANTYRHSHTDLHSYNFRLLCLALTKSTWLDYYLRSKHVYSLSKKSYYSNA